MQNGQFARALSISLIIYLIIPRGRRTHSLTPPKNADRSVAKGGVYVKKKSPTTHNYRAPQ